VAQQEAVVNLLRIHLRESYATGKPAPRQKRYKKKKNNK